jgi:hypothetical protein
MHLIRLLLQAKSILAEGLVPVRVDAHRKPLLEIRQVAWTWEKVDGIGAQRALIYLCFHYC